MDGVVDTCGLGLAGQTLDKFKSSIEYSDAGQLRVRVPTSAGRPTFAVRDIDGVYRAQLQEGMPPRLLATDMVELDENMRFENSSESSCPKATINVSVWVVASSEDRVELHFKRTIIDVQEPAPQICELPAITSGSTWKVESTMTPCTYELRATYSRSR